MRGKATYDSGSEGGVGRLLLFFATPPLPLEVGGTERVPAGAPDALPEPTSAMLPRETALSRPLPIGPKNSTEEVVETEEEAPLLSLRADACCNWGEIECTFTSVTSALRMDCIEASRIRLLRIHALP